MVLPVTMVLLANLVPKVPEEYQDLVAKMVNLEILVSLAFLETQEKKEKLETQVQLDHMAL